MLEILKSNEIIWLVYVIVNYILIIITYKFWGKKGLMMLVPISIIIANVQVNKLVTLFGTQVALGNIAYSSIYVISDILTENYGANESKKLVGFGFFTMIFTSIVMQFALIIKPSESDINHVHLQAIFTMFLRFTIASIIAFVLSSYTDILIYQNIKKIKPGYENIWIRNNASTLLSQIVDNLVFSFIAFLGVYPIGIIISIILSTYFLKIITSIIDTPFVYLATYLKEKIDKGNIMIRYSDIENKREVVLLKGFPCDYSKCAFCNYILDNSTNEDEINEINFEVLKNITGKYEVLEVINSGSIFELPQKTLHEIKRIIKEKNIKVLYCEAYFGYVNKLNKMREFFEDVEIRFMIGIETFDNKYRIKTLKKNFYLTDRIFEKIKLEYNTCLLMICTQGQSKEQILNDLKIGLESFKEVTVSVFVDNGTQIKRDKDLVKWFVNEVYPKYKDNKRMEILIDNKDLGVYVQ